jgi:hypothetical protein
MLLPGQKIILGLLAIITLEAVPFRSYAPFPALLPFFKCILEVMFFGDACDSALIASIVSQWRPFSFSFNWGNRKVGCCHAVMLLLVIKIPS